MNLLFYFDYYGIYIYTIFTTCNIQFYIFFLSKHQIKCGGVSQISPELSPNPLQTKRGPYDLCPPGSYAPGKL